MVETVIRHRWWHLRACWDSDGETVRRYCATCGQELQSAPDDGYRCPIDGSPFCDPMEHH